ncbi:MAG: hypothetical protein Q8O98_00500 [bacterium]|nr:hypothetical protein [bacterium]
MEALDHDGMDNLSVYQEIDASNVSVGKGLHFIDDTDLNLFFIDDGESPEFTLELSFYNDGNEFSEHFKEADGASISISDIRIEWSLPLNEVMEIYFSRDISSISEFLRETILNYLFDAYASKVSVDIQISDQHSDILVIIIEFLSNDKTMHIFTFNCDPQKVANYIAVER